MNVLEIKKLTKKFGDFIAVDDISFSVRHGEIHVRSTDSLKIENVKHINGVQSVEVEGDRVRIHTDMGINNLNRIIHELMKSNVEVLSIDNHRPNLETVFLTLTGRSLRDG